MITELVFILSLDHGWPLRPEHLHCLEDINHTFVPHPLQDNAEGDEDSGSAHASTAVDRDWSILSKLFLGFMHLTDEINKSLSRFGDTLFRPISELELPYCP